MSWIQALIIAIVEGITEFLPISSTGHMIITQHLLGVTDSDFVKIFIVNIQFGAILSVLVLYWKRFVKSIEFYKLLLVAFLPAAIVGFVFGDFIDSLLENIWVVASSLVLGGIVLLILFLLLLFNIIKNLFLQINDYNAYIALSMLISFLIVGLSMNVNILNKGSKC